MLLVRVCFFVLVVSFVVLLPKEALAVRPFVTDDARIVSKGQIEVEAWPELNLVGDEQTYALQFMAGYSFNEWIELIVGSGAGYDRFDRRGTVANPVISPKFLFYRAKLDSWMPGIALDLGTTLRSGRGSLYDDANASYAIVMGTWRFADDWINIHVNAGSRNTRLNGVNHGRKYWGVGLDLGIIDKDYRLIVESYAGDPMEAIAPKVAYQWGGRWLKSDYVNFDLTFGTQREPEDLWATGDRREYWVQFGIRLLFDTPAAKNPSYEGAKGLITRN